MPKCTLINGAEPSNGIQGGPGGKFSGMPWYFNLLMMQYPIRNPNRYIWARLGVKLSSLFIWVAFHEEVLENKNGVDLYNRYCKDRNMHIYILKSNKNVFLCICLHDLKPCKPYNSHYCNNHNHVTPEGHEHSLVV